MRRPSDVSEDGETYTNGICTRVAQGLPPELAAAELGIFDAEFSEWCEIGKKEQTDGKRSEHVDFVTRLAQTEAQLIRTLVGIALSDQQSPEARAKQANWFLERRSLWDFAPPHQRVEVTGKAGEPLIPPDVVARMLRDLAPDFFTMNAIARELPAPDESATASEPDARE